jgi:hypothetical protein
VGAEIALLCRTQPIIEASRNVSVEMRLWECVRLPDGAVCVLNAANTPTQLPYTPCHPACWTPLRQVGLTCYDLEYPSLAGVCACDGR